MELWRTSIEVEKIGALRLPLPGRCSKGEETRSNLLMSARLRVKSTNAREFDNLGGGGGTSKGLNS